MDRGLTCRSSADQSQNVFGNVFSDEINREPIFIPLHPLLRRDLDRFGHLSSAAAIKYLFRPVPVNMHTLFICGEEGIVPEQ